MSLLRQWSDVSSQQLRHDGIRTVTVDLINFLQRLCIKFDLKSVDLHQRVQKEIKVAQSQDVIGLFRGVEQDRTREDLAHLQKMLHTRKMEG